MGIFNKLFTTGRPQRSCPRCRGKGHVDDADIVRLRRQLAWMPGPCAYCNGTGKINASIEDTIPADAAYLTTAVPPEERALLMSGDHEAMTRAKANEVSGDAMVNQIRYLYAAAGLSPEQIARFFMIGREHIAGYEAAYQELVNYVTLAVNIKGDEPDVL